MRFRLNLTFMRETNMSEEIQDTTTVIEEEPKLYAGKFATVEELEKGYNSSLPVHIKNKELEEKLSRMTAIPEQYTLPEGIELDENAINDIVSLSKNAGLNQDQFNLAADKLYKANTDYRNKIEERKASVGEEKLNLVNSYINDNLKGLSDSIKGDILTKVITDESSLSAVLDSRANKLNTSVPGMDANSTPGKKFDMDAQLREASMETTRDPGSAEKRARYIELCNQTAKLRNS